MSAIVKLRLGNLFDGPSDLIVLPCSTSGSVTGFVARSLAHYSIPHPRTGMRLGEVEILPFEGGESIAQFVAFAASVKEMSSSTTAIESIGRALGEFSCEQRSVRAIAAPLLGAGAGGIQSEKVVAAANKVIIVCDETYKQKADGRLGGVGWETMVIQGDIANLPPDSTKYQIIVRAENVTEGLPNYLKTRYAFLARPSDQSQSFNQELVRELLELPLDERLESKEFVL